MMTTLIAVAGAMILSAVLGFVFGQRRGTMIEANESDAYVVELARTRRRLSDAEARARHAEHVAARAKRQTRA